MPSESAAAFEQLAAVLAGGGLTGLLAGLEHELLDADAAVATAATADAGIDGSLLAAALLVRRDVGRLNDLIHACAITLVLPRILEPGEKIVRRPSLGAGNDPSRKYDLETDRRVAEFKVAQWTGADAMRKRTLFQDLVHLAAADTDRRAELYAVGPAPVRFLRTSKSTASWALDKSQPTRQLFEQRFGPLAMSIADFTTGPAAHVDILDLTELLPEVAAATP
ncbi:hypothetical protein [Blastococcus sp. PRF04-17]|uniref:hypothetical protein n=1 Tax=Blastococcus sp. PRF04-17 TaxID=2933797 RepID=UPI001FF583A2|nr:hypothetical protein [Blastococcus sp. PRF04-17]UOY01648.1 hypothetical protein MVA48_22465 [Blastococcus sp. PRF04-17]